jgi:outer membrane protein TolC
LKQVKLLIFVLLLSAAFAAGQQSATPTPPASPPSASARISLEDAIRLALQHNHALQAMRSTIQQSLAEEITANLRPNPTLGLDAQFLPIFQPNKLDADYLDQSAQFDAGIGYLFERGNWSSTSACNLWMCCSRSPRLNLRSKTSTASRKPWT